MNGRAVVRGGVLALPGSVLVAQVFVFCFVVSLCKQGGAQTPAPARNETAALPYMPKSPSGSAASKDTKAQGLIKLDLVVTDKSGKPVTALKARDFILQDNGQPSKILSFQAFNGDSAKPDPPVELILVIDTIDLPGRLASYEKQEVERFLRQNGGRLAHPVSIFWLSDFGLGTLAQTSADGNFLADKIAQNKQIPLTRRTLRNQRGEPLNSLAFEDPPALTALKTLGEIATLERKKPGRKLLLWVGPGWGMGSGKHFLSNLDREQLFDTIAWFSALMREAHLALYSFSVGQVDYFDLTMDSHINPPASRYQAFLNGVKSEREASIENLDRKVIAVQSGGRVLEPADDLRSDIMHTGLTDRKPDFDLVKQINSCVEEANDFYAISFNPADTENTDEYHDLKVEVSAPGLTVRTNTGYYDQPYLYDRPAPTVKQITVEELRQVLNADRSGRDGEVALQLSGLELTERVSDEELSSLETTMRGAKARAELLALADVSYFLDPPATEVRADKPPDPIEQRRLVALVADYLSQTSPRLPNFLATRTTTEFEETPEHYDETGRHRIDYQPLHWVNTSKTTVLYRKGNEIAEPAVEKLSRPKEQTAGLITKGTFGPILGAVSDAIAVPGALTWSHWEQDGGESRAVFHYVIPQNRSRFQVGYCCLLGGDGNSAYRMLTGYHGEIAIYPNSGAILRLTLESDLPPSLPLIRSGVMVEYGPVEIGGRTYICPIKSVSISRSRTIKILTGLSDSFRTFGPYSTMLNDVTFDGYHMFRSEARMLSDFQPPYEDNSPDPGSLRPPGQVPPMPQ
jgi:VWFA-related protein